MNKYKCEGNFNMKTILISGVLVLLVAYGIFNARNILLGPSIEIFSPIAETETGENIVQVKGRVRNMTFLSLNERSIYTDTEGIFEEVLLLSPGFNTIEIKARDRFKQEAKKTIRVYYKEDSSVLSDTSASTTEEIM